MHDALERLAASDPAARAPYRHPDADALITRVLAGAPAPRPAWWRRVQIQLAGGLALAGALAGVLVATLGGGPALPALAISHLSANTAAVSPGAEFAASAAPSTTFRAGVELSNARPHPLSYLVRVPSPAVEMSKLSTVFGLSGPIHRGATLWTRHGASGATLDYQLGGVPQWYYSSTTYPVAPATKSSHASVPMPSHAALSAEVRRDITELGCNYELASPHFSTSTVSIVTAQGKDEEQSQEQVIYRVVANGTATGQTVMFQVDARDRVLYAQGPAFALGASAAYPVKSPREGVRTLNGIASASSGPRPTTLTRVRTTLVEFTLRNGSTWLLPVYTYRGASSETRSWSVLAISEGYAHLSLATARALLANG